MVVVVEGAVAFIKELEFVARRLGGRSVGSVGPAEGACAPANTYGSNALTPSKLACAETANAFSRML